MAETFKVFVYGSLMHDLHNHHLLENSKFIGHVTTYNVYSMYDLGSFPGLCDAIKNSYGELDYSKGYLVRGELYEVDKNTLQALDRLEGEGSFYKRRLIHVYTIDDKFEAWAYFLMKRPQAPLVSRLNSGDMISWKEYIFNIRKKEK